MKCIKTYRREGSVYLAGQEYDIDKDTAKAHEEYLGRPLWEAKSKSQSKREEIQKADKKPATKGK